MINSIRNSGIAIVCFITVFVMSTCDLFTPGLGNKIDVDPPNATLTSITGDVGPLGAALIRNGAYIKGNVALSGSYIEDIGVSNISVSFDEGATFLPASVVPASKTWSCQVSTTLYADGEKSLMLKIDDNSGKSTTTRTLIYVDNTPPMVLVKEPYLFDTNQFNANVPIKGEATDQFGITRVELVFYDDPTAGSAYFLPPGIAEGSNSWSFVFQSSSYIPVAGTCYYTVHAFDKANNESTATYHSKQVKAANNNENITIEDLYKHVRGILTDPDIDPAETAALSLQRVRLGIDQDADKPQITVSYPDENLSQAENRLPQGVKILGFASDDDGTVPLVQIQIDGDPNPWVNANLQGTGGFDYTLPLLSETGHTLFVKATDINDNTNISNPVGFTIDTGAPSITIDSPLMGEYKNGNFQIQGSAADSSAVQSVQVSLDGGTSWLGATPNDGSFGGTSELWYYNVNTGSMDDGNHIFKVRASDGSTSAYSSVLVMFDKTQPTVSFNSPVSSSTINGSQVPFLVVASDNNIVTSVDFIFTKPDPDVVIQLTSSSSIWQLQPALNTLAYENTTYSTEVSTNVWRLDIQARATDIAGNVGMTSGYYVLIDNNTDKPVVNIIAPSNNATLGGPVLISGFATDDDGIDHIEMQMDINGDNDFNDSIDFWNGSSKTLDGFTDDPFENEATWYTIDGTTAWSLMINRFGELYNRSAAIPPVPILGTLRVRVRGVDEEVFEPPKVIGNYQEIAITLDDTIPRIENLSHQSNDYVEGSFDLVGDAMDNSQVSSLWISYDGGINYTEITSGITVYDGGKQWHFVKNIDTTAKYPPGTSGILYLRLKVTDNNTPAYQTISYINLNADNSYPDITYIADSNDINGSGSGSRLQGTAIDSGGSVSGIERIEIYFVKGGLLRSPNSSSSTAPVNYNFGDGGGSVPYVNSDPETSTNKATYVITIDKTTELGNDTGGNGDLDGYNESFTLAGSTYNWWAQFNSANIPDGPVTIHYVVFDKAGNGHHYTQAGIIANDKPQITGITVGYDVDNSGAVQTGERFTYSSEFEAQNRMYIQIAASDANTPLSYEVLKNGGGLNLITSGNSTEFSISAEPAGPLYYLARVTDATGVYASVNVQVNIQNTDPTAPTITINDLTQGNLVDGNIELLNDSTHNGADPDVSGTITVQGTAHDNRGINSITLTLSGVGTDHTVAQWSGGTLASVDPDFVINTQTFNQSGHDISWTYTWNTAAILGSAQDDISFLTEIYDFAANPSSDTLTVDVVPYITDIQRTDGVSVVRTWLGKYTLPEGIQNVNITGYNLNVRSDNPGSGDVEWVRIYNYGKSAYTALTYVNGDVAGDYKTVQVDFGAAVMYSGYLRLSVNNVEAINNDNNNNLSYNSENDGSHPYWYDDRYIHLWDVGNVFNSSSEAEKAAMAVYSDGTQYSSFSIYGQARTYYSNASAVTEIYRSYDPPEWTDIAVNSQDRIYITFLANNTTGTAASYGGLMLYSSTANLNNQRDYDYYAQYRIEEAEWLGIDQLLFEFQNPRITVRGNNTDAHIYISYYDNFSKALKYAHFRDANQSVTGYGTGNNIFNNTLNTATNGTTDSVIYSPGNDQNIIDGTQDPATGDDVGKYSDITTDEGGRPVIVYYDTTNQTLKLARASTINPTAPANWRIQNVFGGADPNRNFVGQYVSVKADASGNIYVSCYRNATGDLIYVYAPQVGVGSDYTFQTSVIVDSEGAVGAWSDIDLTGTTPYIAYQDTSMSGTFEGLKYAYKEGTAWEYGTVALDTPIDGNERVSIAALPSGANPAAANDYIISIGYNSGSYYFGRLRPEQ